MKLPFFEDKASGMYICSVAYDKFKFQVRCPDSSVMGKFAKGCKIRIRGSIDASGSLSYLRVENFKDFELIPKEFMSKENLQKAIFVPRKRKLPEDTEMKVIFLCNFLNFELLFK